MKKSTQSIFKEKSHIVASKRLFLSSLLIENTDVQDYTLNVDSKHSSILAEASIDDINYFNIRNWSGQSDMGAPPQFSLESLNGLGKYSWLRWLNQIIRDYRYFTWQGFYDDVNLLDDLKYLHILEKCSVENVLGYSPFSRHYISGHAFTANERWLRYIYFCGVISSHGLLNSSKLTWIDIGPFYGGLQYVVNSYLDLPLTNVLVDFNHQLCRSFILLSYHFPQHTHFLFLGKGAFVDIQTGSKYMFSVLPDKCFVYCPAHLYKDLDTSLDIAPNLFTNFFSLGEMSSLHFDEYLRSSIFGSSSSKYLVNRVESSPFFEPTYSNNTSILDYLNHVPIDQIRHFGICPIHHYNIIARSLNGRYGPRPTSSNYFELITSN